MLHHNQRRLRGELPPMEQNNQRNLHSENDVVDVVNGTPYTPYLNTTDTTIEQPAVHAKSNNSNAGNDALAIFLLILFFGPCVLACIMQTVYRWRKRRQDRVEREIMEVTTNPTSRRMVLDEIFKGSAKLVEFPSNRRRVQVKKHRRKTPEERGLDVEHDTTLEDGSAVNDVDDELCSVRGRMIICVSGKNGNEDAADDVSSTASSVHSIERNGSSGSGNSPNSVDKEAEHSSTIVHEKDLDRTKTSHSSAKEETDVDDESVKKVSPDCLRQSLDAEKAPALIKLSIPDVDVNNLNALALHPKRRPNPHNEAEHVNEETSLHSNEVSPGSKDLVLPSFLCPEMEAGNASFGLVIPALSDDSTDDEDDESLGEEGEKSNCQAAIFRKEARDGMKIEPSSSTMTEVTSNVADTGMKSIVSIPSTHELQKASSNLSSECGMELEDAFPLKNVQSNKSNKSNRTDTSSKADTSSNISYYSYEEVSIASEESDMCAICLCPYYEGDVRIFSKKCPHAFHKDCLFEWLVKGHDECPCCRIEMVTKAEVKETSASLIGTERLAEALASSMVEAPPLRFQQARMAWARARQHRRSRSRQAQVEENESNSSAIQNSINSHWLWNARFDLPSPSSAEGRTSLAPVNETFPQPAGQTSSTTISNIPTASQAPLETRSFDALMDSQPAELTPTRSFDAITDPTQTESSQRNGTANTRNFHSHWASWNQNAQLTRTPRRSNSTFAATHTISRLSRRGSDNSSRLPVTVLPTI